MATADKVLSTSTVITVPGNTTSSRSRGLVNDETLHIFQVVNFVIITGVICFFGIISNTINMIIFFRQGLDNTINISFFGLALSDFCSVLTLEWTTISFNPLFVNSGIPWETRHIQYLTGAWPHLCFGHITCWITTYITAERCLCIAMPLKVKQIVTPRRTATIIFLLYLINILSGVPEYSSAYYDWVFYPERNRTLLGLAVRENRDVLEPLGFVLFAILGTVSFPAVVIFTAILVVKLRSQAKWRTKSSHEKKADLTSKRDIKTMKMVVLIAFILIVCYTPGILASITVFLVPSFNIKGVNVNLYYVIWSFVAIFEAFNSSVNIFLYYSMSTKYKHEFSEMFNRCSQHGLDNNSVATKHVD